MYDYEKEICNSCEHFKNGRCCAPDRVIETCDLTEFEINSEFQHLSKKLSNPDADWLNPYL